MQKLRFSTPTIRAMQLISSYFINRIKSRKILTFSKQAIQAMKQAIQASYFVDQIGSQKV